MLVVKKGDCMPSRTTRIICHVANDRQVRMIVSQKTFSTFEFVLTTSTTP